MDNHRRDALLKEYGEVSSNFRLLTDIRFKLVALLPVASAAAAAFKGDSPGFGAFVLSLFGLAATIGLVTYNTRNDQLYDELVGRAASIERGLGLADGASAFVFSRIVRAWIACSANEHCRPSKLRQSARLRTLTVARHAEPTEVTKTEAN
jgi:hypothetical protein